MPKPAGISNGQKAEMADPFTIRIFVPDGDPEGVRLIDRMNWTGIGIAFPRTHLASVRDRSELAGAGVYVLVGYSNADDDLPTVYVGQADHVGRRLDQHNADKEFWDWGIAFVSTSGGLNRAHATWLEYALIRRARDAGRCHLDNGNNPQEPRLSEAEKADTTGFLKEILQILPLVGLRAFEEVRPVATPRARTPDPEASSQPATRRSRSAGRAIADTIVVPAQKEGFEEVFLGQDEWYAIRISGGMIDKIKYFAVYQTQPVSAITHYAPVDRIEPYGEGGKYRLIFSEPATAIDPIPFGKAPQGTMQGPRYTTLERLKAARDVRDVIGRDRK